VAHETRLDVPINHTNMTYNYHSPCLTSNLRRLAAEERTPESSYSSSLMNTGIASLSGSRDVPTGPYQQHQYGTCPPLPWLDKHSEQVNNRRANSGILVFKHLDKSWNGKDCGLMNLVYMSTSAIEIRHMSTTPLAQ
jgi:hypothetical protein